MTGKPYPSPLAVEHLYCFAAIPSSSSIISSRFLQSITKVSRVIGSGVRVWDLVLQLRPHPLPAPHQPSPTPTPRPNSPPSTSPSLSETRLWILLSAIYPGWIRSGLHCPLAFLCQSLGPSCASHSVSPSARIPSRREICSLKALGASWVNHRA